EFAWLERGGGRVDLRQGLSLRYETEVASVGFRDVVGRALFCQFRERLTGFERLDDVLCLVFLLKKNVPKSALSNDRDLARLLVISCSYCCVGHRRGDPLLKEDRTQRLCLEECYLPF